MTDTMTPERLLAALAVQEQVTNGDVYRDSRTGWVGRAMVPSDPTKVFFSPADGRPKIGLKGPSGKEDRVEEIRFGFVDDLVPDGGPATGFGG